MGMIASPITSITVVYSTVCSYTDQRKHQSSTPLAFVRGIHRSRWIPRTKGQLRGNFFHLMTLSWYHSFVPGTHVMIFAIWGLKNAPWVQALHASFFIGCTLAPLLVKLFLSTQPTESHKECSGVDEDDKYLNITTHLSTVPPNTMETTGNVETEIWKPYLIAGVILIVPATVFILVSCVHTVNAWTKSAPHKDKTPTRNSQLGQFILIGLMATFIYLNISLERGVGSFLLAYAVQCLGWDKGDAAFLKTAFQASAFTGRVSGILVVRVLSAAKLLSLLSVVCLVAVIVLVTWKDHVTVMWLSTIMTGLSASPMYGYCITWSSQYIFVTGKVGALLTLMGAISDVVGPLIVNLLYDNFGLATYPYYCLVLSIAMVICCGLIALNTKFIVQLHKSAQKSDIAG